MIKICIICKEKIIEKKERWVCLTDFNKGKKMDEEFYHLECWKERFVITNSARKRKMYRQTQESIGKILNAFNLKPYKEYDIVIK